jgi:hypothetical protein
MYDPPDEPLADAPLAVEPGAEPSGTDPQHRFQSCRWHKPADGAQPAHCTHREVLPMAGVHGFSPESWCPECAFFKLRRVPRRR